ncbi:MAG: bacteriohemerythrin [Proteobacteria bacterium]|nr:bacteriohemerythrin [Pseudomonadota bacterium]
MEIPCLEYKNLANAYVKLLKQSKKLLKVGDSQQKKLTTQQDRLTSLANTLKSNNVKLQQQNKLIRKVFGRYLSDEIVETLFETESGLSLGGECREITILTSDIRGFTAQANQMPPEQVIKILNFYLATMADVITKYQGTINNFMGDGILVLFGAPIVRANNSERAVACAMAMQLAMETINEKIQTWGFVPLEMGIGIHTGEVVVGNIGSEKRTQYTVIGNNVNLAYRIEGYTVGGQVIISGSTLKQVDDIVKITSEKSVKPKGIKQAITIYEIEGINGEYNLHLRNKEEVFIPLKKNISLKYQILKGKQVQEHQFSGRLIKISAKKALIQCLDKSKLLLKPMNNIKINLIIPNTKDVSEDVYAKVLSVNKNYLYICFTTIPVNVRTQLIAFYKVKWTADLSINYPIIDKQHQQLLNKLQDLVNLINHYKEEKVVETIIILRSYVINHFETEEHLMQQYNYPNYIEHREQHAKFINMLNDCKQRYEQTPEGLLYLSIKIQQDIVSWWISHIDNCDRQLGIFLLETES